MAILLQPRRLVFTDLDGSMMSYDGRIGDNAYYARLLRMLGFLVVPVTAKTIEEVLALRGSLGLDQDPFIAVVEAGGAVYATPGVLTRATGFDEELGLDYIEVGEPLEKLEPLLEEVASTPCSEKLYRLTRAPPEIAKAMTGLEGFQAGLAQRRRYIEVYWSPSRECMERAARRAEELGLTVRTGRLLHVGRGYGKARAARKLMEEPLFSSAETVGIGDTRLDEDLLEAADTAVVVPQPGGRLLARPRRADYHVAPEPAPEGWAHVARLLALGVL